ncbi:MAG: DUF2760 domain-containing protein [Pirellulales bacterium]|nr:DUF2760 domain-containing protein [Pirellulales bacterium]
MRLLLALRAFFRVLFDGTTAGQVRGLLEGPPAEKPVPEPVTKKPATPQPSPTSDALALLAALQREARLIDFIQESLDGYSDAQIGAAVRDVHRDCGKVLERMFALQPVLTEQEGAQVDVAEGFDANSYRLTGNVTGQPPYRGTMVHHGWKATRCDVPRRTGSSESARVIAPVEVELP